jgi:hypothetical protein
MDLLIVGVDCATVSDKVGLSLVVINSAGKRLVDVSVGDSLRSPAEQIANWIPTQGNALIALDAPLGWPIDLGRQLSTHSAGSPIDASPEVLFRRETDRYVEQVGGKRPLEVGADRIARTAVAALALLAELGDRLREPIPLAWSHIEFAPVSAIEVYPAATLRARSLRSEGYKRRTGVELRRELCGRILREFSTELNPADIWADDNVFDAVLCAVAGIDFVEGKALRPDDMKTARHEGWIWFSNPGA